ncbi:hypothetical protein TNCV_359061 [Trichonephila clavipes]|nr:hypothetical protein TNCV_359061 [Trichonephila clavipes]
MLSYKTVLGDAADPVIADAHARLRKEEEFAPRRNIVSVRSPDRDRFRITEPFLPGHGTRSPEWPKSGYL